MEDDDYWYSYYQSKYYDACYEVSCCENRIYNLQNERKKVVNLINKLKTDIENTQTAIDGITEARNCETTLNSDLTTVGAKTEDATTNFKDMVVLSEYINKSFTEVYSDETTKTKNTISTVMESLDTNKTNLNTKLTNLKTELKNANTQLQGIDSDISRENSSLSYWNSQKSSYYYSMSYYS